MRRVDKSSRESGLVSLVVCMVLMIILTLITISFATISRREQRQALDRQLSTQAFYAAETGINDVSAAIEAGTLTDDIRDCSEAEQNKLSSGGDLNTNANVARTCVFVNLTPNQLDSIVSERGAKVYKISAPNLSSLDIFWENDSLTAAQTFPGFSGAGDNFPPNASWNGNTRPGVLAIQLIPAGFPTSRSQMQSGLISVYGFPTSSSSNQTHVVGTDPNGEVLTGACSATNTPRHCRVTISGLSGEYYIRLLAIYDPVHITIEGNDSSGDPVSFAGAQVEIDSTGRSSDVVRRIKVFKPVRLPSDLPDYVLEIGDDLCKRLETDPTNTTYQEGSVIPACKIDEL